MRQRRTECPLSRRIHDTLLARRRDFLAFVQRRVRDHALAEDLVQAALEHALAHLGEVRDEKAVVGWFYRSLHNAILDRQRRRATEERALDRFAREIEEWADAIEMIPPRICRCVLRVARDLKSEYADSLQEIVVDGSVVKDFAARSGISSSNAAVRVFRARQALRRGVLATCGACAEGGCVDCTCADGEAHGPGGHGSLRV